MIVAGVLGLFGGEEKKLFCIMMDYQMNFKSL